MSQIIEAGIVGVMILLDTLLWGCHMQDLLGVVRSTLIHSVYRVVMACGIGMLSPLQKAQFKHSFHLVVFMIVQIVEGNVVYPKVVGSSVGLLTILTLAAALIGGNLFGLVGMIFFIPIFAVIYRFL